MRHVLLLQVFENQYDLGRVELDYLLFESKINVFFDEFFERAVRNVFHYNLYMFIVIESVVEVGQEGKLATIYEYVALPEHVWNLSTLDQEVF